MKKWLTGWMILGLALAVTSEGAEPTVFGKLRLVEEIACGESPKEGLFQEFPSNTSKVEEILGKRCRVLKPREETTQYMAWRVGKGCGLKPGKAYVLSVEYPEDTSRTMFLHNGGNEANTGFATGEAVGDVVMGRYVNHNPESLKYPLSGEMQEWQSLFYLHDRFPGIERPRGKGDRPLTPEDGFWLILSQPYAYLDPLSAGAAVSRIALYEVEEPEKLALEIPYPPENLPRRHLFWREEMSDGVVEMGKSAAEKDERLRGVRNPADWYEYKMWWAKAMGINTFCKDLLEFGHNQGWDSEPYGGTRWINQSATPQLWDELVERATRNGMSILPYYEYAGSIGADEQLSLGRQKRAKRLDGGDRYTHIWWSEKANVDLSDPDTLRDFEKILDLTVLKYHGEADFLGAWLRPRVSANPVSFNERNLQQFSKEALSGSRVTREELQKDKELLTKYYDWWFTQRKRFLENVASYLRTKGNPKSFVLYTTDAGEPGYSIPWQVAGIGKKDSWRYKTNVVNEEMEKWEKILQNPIYEKKFVKPVALSEVLEKNYYADALRHWTECWAGGENHHATPPADPEHYRRSRDVMLSYTIHRSYSASDTATMEAYRTGAGLTVVRHFPLNEHELNVKKADGKEWEPTGYFVIDVERAGPFCMMPEVRSVAFGDPTCIGYLTGNTFQRGFPEYVRAFNAAFLSLPALPSKLHQVEKYGKEHVRKIETSEGTWWSVCSLDYEPKTVRIDGLPVGFWQDCVTGELLPIVHGSLSIKMAPMSLRSFRLLNSPPKPSRR